MAPTTTERGPSLSISELAHGGELRLAVSGELDAATAPTLIERLERFERDNAATVALDLAGVTFMDVAGMRTLLEASWRARAAERRFVLYNPRRIARRVFDLAAVDQDLEIAFDEQPPS